MPPVTPKRGKVKKFKNGKKKKNRDLFYKFCDYIKSEKIDLYIMNNKILSYELNSKKITLNELIKLHDYEIEEKFLE